MAVTSDTTYVTTPHREIGSANDQIIKTFRALASTEYTYGDFVTIDTAGRVTAVAANDAKIDGIVVAGVDNSDGAADAVNVPVLLRGNIWVDCLCGATGDWDDVFAVGSSCGVGGDGGTTAATGTAVVATGTAGNRTFTSLSTQALPTSATILRKGLFYFRGSAKFV